jgi:hypothetical protein
VNANWIILAARGRTREALACYGGKADGKRCELEISTVEANTLAFTDIAIDNREACRSKED